MAYEVILLTKQDGIATITLNRPPMNPLNTQVYQELIQAIDDIQVDPSVKAVIITGAGEKAMAAGADILEMANLTPVEVYTFCHNIMVAFSKIENLGKPVIAAINGFCLGGGTELTLTCDFRIAADTAKFGLPEINLGIIPGTGGTQRLPRLIGIAKAKELIFLGDIIDATTALTIGLVNKVVPLSSLMEEAVKLAKKLATKPAVAMKMAKASINTGMNLDITSALTLEIQNVILAFASDDSKEGMTAFMEKRKPNFTDK